MTVLNTCTHLLTKLSGICVHIIIIIQLYDMHVPAAWRLVATSLEGVMLAPPVV